MAKAPSANARVRAGASRSEEHTSELQSRSDLVCRLLLEKKKKNLTYIVGIIIATILVASVPGGVILKIYDMQACFFTASVWFFFVLMRRRPPRFTLFPYTTLFR